MLFCFRHPIRNEAFEKWPFADACKAMCKGGDTGIEIAPFTISRHPNLTVQPRWPA